MQDTILWVYIVLLVAGGLVGFLKAGSKASIIASGVFAVPLVLAALHVLPGRVADVVLAILLIFFGAKFARKRAFMPAGLMAILSAAALAARILIPA